MELATANFWTAFFAAMRQFQPEQFDLSLRPPDTPQNELLESYSFVIVGAGAAGSVLANRLTENSDWTVLLIEAGGEEDVISDTPLLEIFNHGSPKDWNYTTVSQKKACLSKNGICNYPRGHVMGGSTTINGMMYVRGHKEDFEEWKKMGLTNWGYESVLPYFIKAENNTEPSLASSPYHGHEGPLNVQYPKFITPLRDEYIQAGEEIGWVKKDYNAPFTSNIIDYVQFTMDGPSRESTSKAYLRPIRDRKNLHVIKHSFVSKVLIEKRSAKGVEYHRDGRAYTVRANKEVILSAGAIDTPKLLMLSGIGPRKDLKKLGIKVVANLPVGQTMQDHPLIPLYFKLKNAQTITTDIWKTNKSIIKYAEDLKGPLTTTGGEIMSFHNPLDKDGLPTVQTMIHSFIQKMDTQTESLLDVGTANVRPKSFGSVKLRSNNFKDPPLIDPNYFGEEVDYLMVEKGMERIFDFMNTTTMRKYSPRVYHDNQPACKDKEGTAFIRCTIDQYSQTVYHPVATARMGRNGDSGAVVDQDLRVRKVKKLRVVDASVIPKVPRANTMAPTIMVAEKASDIIKLFYKK